MSDSEKTNDLDNYGVWVKKPPRTVSTENTADEAGIDFPDFSTSDIVDNTPFDTGDTALSASELSALTGDNDTQFIDDTSSSSPSNETEEISLDEFIEGGVFEGDDESASSSSAEPAPATSEAIIADEPSDDITISDSVTISDSTDSPSLSDDDVPLNIDLSFDDSPVSESSGFAADSASPSDGSESVDLSDFGVDFGSDDASNSSGSESVDLSEFGVDFSSDSDSGASTTEESNSSGTTEDVDLSDFGVDFSSDEGAGQPAAEPAATEEPAVAEESAPSEDGMESISLDSFGFDINAEESTSAVSQPEPEEQAQEEESVSDITEPAASEDLLTVSDDDNLSLSPEPEAPAQEEPQTAPVQTSTTEDDDGFDVDSIMSSIEDENGSTFSLADEPATESAEPQIVENEEPVFEETSVDEPIMEEPVAPSLEEPVAEEGLGDIKDDFSITFEDGAADFSFDQKAEDDEKTLAEDNFTAPLTQEEDSNPFSLPDTDSFMTESSGFTADPPSFDAPQETEPSNIPTDTVATEEFSDNIEPASEPAFEEPAFTETSVPEQTFEQPAEETISEPAFDRAPESFVSTPDEPQTSFTEPEPATSVAEDVAPSVATDAAQDAAPAVEKDAEIEASTNKILSQIVSELANLKSEISGLKTDFEELKNKTPDEFSTIEAEPKEEQTGFFADSDGDDTIALSVDELDNILNTVEIVEGGEENPSQEDNFTSPLAQEETAEPAQSDIAFEEPAASAEETVIEEPAQDTDFDFSSENLEEPTLDKIDNAQNLPEEILVPKSDDILVESGSSNFIEETPVTSTEPADVFASETAETTDDSFTFEAPAEEPSIEESASVETDISSDGSTETDTSAEAVDEPFVYDDENSNISVTEQEVQDLLDKESELESIKAQEAAKEKPASENSTIPGELQKEIKSVLSYMDQLLENLPEDKIAEFAQSEQFETYKKLFKELGLA